MSLRRHVRAGAASALVRAAALLVVMGSLSNAAVAEEPVGMDDLLAMVRHDVPEEAVASLLEARGMSAPVGPEELIALRDAGYSAEFVTWLAAAQPGGLRLEAEVPEAAPDGVDVAFEDGVLRLSAYGEPPAEPARPVEAPRTVQEPVVVERVVERIVPVPVATTSHESEPSGTANPHPVGAAFGPTGSAVFIPARFGDPASSFGRTIVTVGPTHPYPYWHPHAAPLLVPGAPVVAPAPRNDVIPIRTSRGTIWLPN